jgi:glycosyltransferase involved in cell wall biosynthesis
LGTDHRPFAQNQFTALDGAGLAGQWEYIGEVDRQGKARFLQSLDLLCVPTNFLEPKGIYVLEALASGVPVLVPKHGAFPELMASTGGGHLFEPGNSDALADALRTLVLAPEERLRLAESGREAVLRKHSADHGAEVLHAIYQDLAEKNPLGTTGG